MTGQQIFDLMLDGAYLMDGKLFHPQFKKGFRKCLSSDVAFQAALRKLSQAGKQYTFCDGKYSAV